MRALALAGMDGVVGDEPCIATTAAVGAAGMLPSLDVRLVGVGNTSRAAVEFDRAGPGEMEDVLVAVVDVALGVDRFEVSGADRLGVAGFDRDRFDPVKGVLKLEEIRRC